MAMQFIGSLAAGLDSKIFKIFMKSNYRRYTAKYLNLLIFAKIVAAAQSVSRTKLTSDVSYVYALHSKTPAFLISQQASLSS